MDRTHGHEHDPAARHEERDASTRGILWFAAGLVATVVAVLVLMKWTFNVLPTPQTEAGSPPYVQGVTNELPPEPRLQVHAPEDLKKMREEEDSVLGSYGWVDRQNGIVRIPVERAMELLVRRGNRPLAEKAPKQPGK